MTRSAVVLFAVLAALFVSFSSAKILTFSGWPRTATPLGTVAAARDTFTDVGALKTTRPSLESSSSGVVDSSDSDDTASVLQTASSGVPSSVGDEGERSAGGLTDGSDEDSSDDISSSASSDDSNDDAALTGGSMAGSLNAAFEMGSVLNATSTIEPTYVNWVGTELDTSIASACYREAHIAKTCPLGFDASTKPIGTCWAECPYAYPVECGMECIRQNDDCALEVATKVGTVVQTTLSLATMNVFGNFYKLSKGIVRGVKCFKAMLGLTKSLIKYVRYIKVSNPETSEDKILAILYQTDNVVIDIPVTVAYCLGKKVSDDVKLADRILTTAELALREVIKNDAWIVSSWAAFTGYMKNITLGESVKSLNESDITSLKSALKANSTCGYDMKRLLDRTWMTVAEFKKENPTMSEDDIRVALSQSSLMLNDIPIATNNCMNELIANSDEAKAYDARDSMRKAFGGIVDDLISSGTSSNGTYLTAQEYTFRIADKVLALYAIWDMWAVTGLVSEYFQPICGPTQLIGEIDDGPAKNALGMSIVQKAFNGSDGLWSKTGDGTATITFKSADTEDVSVNIKSGGDKIAEVNVPAGGTATWTADLKALGGKTLYLDRWRPGFLGLPGTGGGSLLLWVPRTTQGGNFQLTAKLNVS